MAPIEAREGLTFPRSLHLLRSSDFRRVQGRGHKVRRPSLLVVWLPRRGAPSCRVGLTVSRKVGNAVARNRVKRWLREATRHELHRLTQPVDVVIIAHPRAAEAGAEALRAEVRGAFRDIATGRTRRRKGGSRRRGPSRSRNSSSPSSSHGAPTAQARSGSPDKGAPETLPDDR